MSEADAFRRRMARYMRDAERRYLAAGRGELAADVAQLAARLAAPAEPPGLPGSGTAQGVDNDAGAASVAGGAGEAVTGASPSPAYCSHYACRCARAAELAALADRTGDVRHLAEAIAVHGRSVPCRNRG